LHVSLPSSKNGFEPRRPLSALYQATLIDNTANNNGYGVTADDRTKVSGNHAKNNTSGNCHHVSCVH
jgi:hypothetical protein